MLWGRAPHHVKRISVFDMRARLDGRDAIGFPSMTVMQSKIVAEFMGDSFRIHDTVEPETLSRCFSHARPPAWVHGSFVATHISKKNHDVLVAVRVVGPRISVRGIILARQNCRLVMEWRIGG